MYEMKRAEQGPSALMNGAEGLTSECVRVGGFMKARQQVPGRLADDSIVNQTETHAPLPDQSVSTHLLFFIVALSLSLYSFVLLN